MLNDDLKKLYSPNYLDLILYCLYRLSGDKRYKTISKLAYALDEKNFINLINQFQGETFTVPTVERLQYVLDAFKLYIAVNLEGEEDIDKVIKSLQLTRYQSVSNMLDIYLKLNSYIDNKRLPPEKLKGLKNYLITMEKDLSYKNQNQPLKQSVEDRLEKTNRRYMEELNKSVNTLQSSEVLKAAKKEIKNGK